MKLRWEHLQWRSEACFSLQGIEGLAVAQCHSMAIQVHDGRFTDLEMGSKYAQGQITVSDEYGQLLSK